jgi:26S proteasome regulatory subunit N10
VSNNELLTAFINALNGKDGAGSHLVSVPPGPHLSDALISSPVIQVLQAFPLEGVVINFLD